MATPTWSYTVGSICWTNYNVAVSTESWDYGDALGGRNDYRLVVNNEKFKTTATEAWQQLPSQCNARSARDAAGNTFTLEPIFQCAHGTDYISLYTDR